jgi:hypothetical protein
MNVADSFLASEIAEKRMNNQTILLQALDKYIDDVIATDHRTEFGKLPIIVKEILARAIQANIEYHQLMAKANEKESDVPMSNLHNITAETYKSIIPK